MVSAAAWLIVISLFLWLAWVLTDPARQAGRRTRTQKNIREISIGCQTYPGDHEGLLPQSSTQADNRGLSWRVLILPYIEQLELYNQFHLDEAWDSPHNIKLLDKMPEVYLSPMMQWNSDRKKGLTHFRCFTGKGTPMGSGKPVSLGEISKAVGTARTILFVEATEPVFWTKPDELEYEPDKPLPPLGREMPPGFYAVFCDGSVYQIHKGMLENKIRAWIRYDDGMDVPPPYY